MEASRCGRRGTLQRADSSKRRDLSDAARFQAKAARRSRTKGSLVKRREALAGDRARRASVEVLLAHRDPGPPMAIGLA